MVNARKHKALVQDYETRVIKMANSIFGNNAKKQDKKVNHLVSSKVGKNVVIDLERYIIISKELLRGLKNGIN